MKWFKFLKKLLKRTKKKPFPKGMKKEIERIGKKQKKRDRK